MVLRPLTRLGNVAGFQNLQDGGQVNGAVLHLEKGSPFLLHLASLLPGCCVAAFRQLVFGTRRGPLATVGKAERVYLPVWTSSGGSRALCGQGRRGPPTSTMNIQWRVRGKDAQVDGGCVREWERAILLAERRNSPCTSMYLISHC